MARSWRDYSAPKGESASCDKRDISDESPPSEHSERPIVPNVTNVTGLPSDIRQGITWLSNAPAPRIRRPADWPGVVADALRLVSDGWAGQAIGLGWSPLDLFGAVPNVGGDPGGDGLAVWLNGRRVVALTAQGAAVESKGGGRAYFVLPRPAGAVLLWKLGRGR